MQNEKAPRYWAMRTDQDNRKLLAKELLGGRLRQGWGYLEEQDLTKIQATLDGPGGGATKLSAKQREALPHLRMLGRGEDAIHAGDLIVAPNLPEYGFFSIVKVTGPYRWRRLELTTEQDNSELKYDYGHILPVQNLTPKGVNKLNGDVGAGLRKTLKAQSRLWSLDPYAKEVDRLVDAALSGKDLTSLATANDRLESAWDRSMVEARATLVRTLGLELPDKFQGAEWEKPIVRILRRLYPGADIRHTAGKDEHGADIVIDLPNVFVTDQPWRIVVQVKNYDGAIGEKVLAQIEEAFTFYGSSGRLLAGIIMTTATSESKELADRRIQVADRHRVPIHVVLRHGLLQLMAEGLGAELQLPGEQA